MQQRLVRHSHFGRVGILYSAGGKAPLATQKISVFHLLWYVYLVIICRNNLNEKQLAGEMATTICDVSEVDERR
jgi:hypothetical protein